MIKFKRYPYRVGENYGMNGGLTKRQITMAINKPVRQAKKLQQKAPLLAELITAEPIQDFDAKAEYERRQAALLDWLTVLAVTVTSALPSTKPSTKPTRMSKSASKVSN